MQETTLFPTLLLEDFPDINNEILLEACYDLKKQSPHNESPGGWQSDWSLKDDRFDELKKRVQGMMDTVQKHYYHIDKPIKITNEWVNINYPKGDTNNINQVHMHDRNVLSCVYYVQADNHCGNLTLMAPHQLYDFAVPYRYIKQPNAWNSTRFSIKPEPGKLVCFPSYLLHSAGINHSNRDRISIAFNGDINET